VADPSFDVTFDLGLMLCLALPHNTGGLGLFPVPKLSLQWTDTSATLGVLLNHLPLIRQSRINPGLINPSKGDSGDAESRV
jgi:hypothetical protein